MAWDIDAPPYGMKSDGTAVCTNSEPGHFNHECGKPATVIGYRYDGYAACYCDRCKEIGSEARTKVRFEPVETARLALLEGADA